MVIRRLLGYLQSHRKALSGAFSILLLATVADLAGPILVKKFIDEYLTPGIMEARPLIYLGSLYLALQIASVILNYIQLLAFNRIALQVIKEIRIQVFSKVQQLGMQFFDQTPVGWVVSRITNDTQAIKELYVSTLSTFVQSIVFLVGTFVAFFILDRRLALYCLILLPLLIILIQVYRYFSSIVYRTIRRLLSSINTKVNETLQNMSIVQAFRQEASLHQEFAQVNNDLYSATMREIRLESLLLRPAVDLLYLLALLLVLSYFGLEGIGGTVKIGVLYAFTNYLGRFFEPINMIMMKLSQLQQSVVAAERVFAVLDEERLAPAKEGDEEHIIQAGAVEFRNVTFSYDNITDVLRDVSFVVQPGQTVALVGHTGSGKSTTANLLMRFYPVCQGRIFIDRVPLNSFSDEELRRNLAQVLQEPFLFYGSVAENIRFHNAHLSTEKIAEAAALVQADVFINRLAGGYEEIISERGATLSSGQRQLLSYARAIVAKPKILILDEATASVDTETEEAIQNALRRMRQGRTTLVIAHRLSTIQDADIILVFRKGRIVERGNHQELLERQGLYYKMYLLQQGGAV